MHALYRVVMYGPTFSDQLPVSVIDFYY